MDTADDLTFRIIFSGDGAGRLRDKVKEKLKEFMGDYTDDTLVEYVIVLLKNGRRKEEAKNELNVFLGDDSDSFVSWLWDHLRSNLNLYAQPKDEVVKQKKDDGKSESEGININKSNKASKKRVSKDWRGVMRDPNEPPPLRSAVIANIHNDDNTLQSRSPSPQPRKRGRSGERGQIDERIQTDERSQVKREAVSKPGLGASRRLLQFAVRDAVATSRSTPSLTSEPSLKRLRSVVSTPNEDLQIEEHRPKIRSVARVPKSMAVAIKAVADAAKDVVKVKPSGNVFDRLGRSTDNTVDQFDYRETGDEDTQIIEATVPTYYDEGYENMDRRGKMGISQIGSDSVMVDYNAVSVVDKPQRDHNSSNLNSGKPRAILEIENQKAVQETQLGAGAGKGNSVIVSNGNGAPTINPTGRPIEDVDSRTIFVSNVHFGATKDSLSRHFNKFGDVLKVVIITEAATGQPKGSAYVEFMRKEAAENALSLDGTSFMSRILKVVRKSSANQEATTPLTTWARATRASPFTASRFGRAPFPRGVPNLYRPRLPLKPGARSLQWKRDAQNPSSENIASPTAAAAAIPSPTTAARSLTYVRPNSNNA
ncbi:hypothetical protein L1887_17938 [Cichorium endivia]|nr:hypothetical protein L1887_17938 [Cichorium endivia]